MVMHCISFPRNFWKTASSYYSKGYPKTRNEPQWLKMSQIKLKSATMNQNERKWATMSHDVPNIPQYTTMSTVSHNKPKLSKASNNKWEQDTMSQKQPQGATISNNDPNCVTMSYNDHNEPQWTTIRHN